MAVGLYFGSASFTPGQYDQTIQQLEAAGAGAPAGRLYHFALEADGQIRVLDVWESEESSQAFGATLIPILTSLGAEAGEPQVAVVRNVIEG